MYKMKQVQCKKIRTQLKGESATLPRASFLSTLTAVANAAANNPNVPPADAGILRGINGGLLF